MQGSGAEVVSVATRRTLIAIMSMHACSVSQAEREMLQHQ